MPGNKNLVGSQVDDKLELELHTPKSPTAPIIMDSQDAQTYEEDFSEPYRPGKGAKSKGGKEKKK